MSTFLNRVSSATVWLVSSVALLLVVLNVAFAVSATDSRPIPDVLGLPPFDHTLTLLDQRSNSKLALKYVTAMTNQGIEQKATGTVDAQVSASRSTYQSKFTLSLANLLPNTAYQLKVLIGNDVNSTNATSITTDGSGAFHATYVMGKSSRGSTPMPPAMHPLHGLRELDVVNASSQVVLRADQVDPNALKYQAMLQMHNTGFIPTASGSIGIRATPINVSFLLAAKKLQPSTSYVFLVNGMAWNTIKSDQHGTIRVTFNSHSLRVFDIRTIALTDQDRAHVVLALFPGSGNGIFPADHGAPTVISTNPGFNATGVPINAAINATFNEGMDPATINNTTFLLVQTVSGVSTNGNITYTSATATATFAPATNLLPYTTYTATITTGAKDVAGNEVVSNYIWNFTTGAGADNTSPTVTFTSPTNGSVNVPVNRIINVAFSEVMASTTISAATFKLVQTISGVSTNGNITYSGTSATFAPLTSLSLGTSYTATITNGATDLAGNAMASDFSFVFTTGAAADTIPPTVSVTSPTDTAADVPINRKVTVGFSEAMNPATISTASFTLKETVSGNSVAGTVTPIGTSAVFAPTSDLAASTKYTATITTGVKDLAGNAMASNFSFTFTTGAAADKTAPTVSFTAPTDGAKAVPINQVIQVAFSETMDPLTLTTDTFAVTGPGMTPVDGTVSHTGTTATFIPFSTNGLDANVLFTCTITTGAKDLAGNSLATNYVWTFTTTGGADTTDPTVLSTIPLDGATLVAPNSVVTATFSEAMNTITTAMFTVKATVSSIDVGGTVAYAPGSNTATYTPPSGTFAPSTQYTVTIKGGLDPNSATDLAGNPLASGLVPNPWTFTTGAAPDKTAPTVTLAVPANLASNEELNISINATFSEAMAPLTLSTATFTVQASGPPAGPLIAGWVTYDTLSHIATFTPKEKLAASTQYTATITTGATDLAGNALVSGLVPNPWTFTTGTGLAPNAVPLGSAATYGIMATATVANTGPSTINGDVSLDPGSAMTGFPPGVVNGTIHINDTVSAKAKEDLLAAYNWAKSLPADPGLFVVGTVDLGQVLMPGHVPGNLPPGIYSSGSTMLASTPVTLDAGGNANAVWVFQIGSSLTTNGTGNVLLAGGAQAKNVFFVPTVDATIGAGTVFNGTIVTGRDATGVSGARIFGRILAGALPAGGAINLDTNTVIVPAP
ncbi:MAG TPA: Ig-like domain-containing protein [Planctomycetota bacterium]|jgi:hypothetical protein